MNTKRYSEVREAVLQALETRTYTHEERSDRPAKNLLWAQLVDEAFVIELVKACPAGKARRSEHHGFPHIDVWTLSSSARNNDKWYVKFYLLGGVVFISVHPAEG